MKLLSELEVGNQRPVHTFGVDVNLLEALAEHSLEVSLPFVHETALKKETAGSQVWLIDDCTFQSDYFRTKEKELSFPYRRVKVKGVEPPEPDASCVSAAESPKQPESQADALSVSAFLDACGEGDLVIFLDSRNAPCFYDEKNKERFQRMIPLRVRNRRLREENVFFPDRDQTICVYTGDAGIREKAMRFHAGIVLKNTGLAAEIQASEQTSGDAAACEQSPEEESAPETHICMEEYLDLVMDLNDMSMKAFLRDKINMFLRPGLREFMRRPALVPTSSTDEQIRQFLRTWGKIVGKRNTSAGEGFQIYEDDVTDPVGQIRSDGADILEPYIRQHTAYQAIYPHSLNTIRIHTVRSGGDVRIFLPLMLSVGGGGAVTDVSAATTRYRVLLSEDGSILRAFRQDPGGSWQDADRHHDTGDIHLLEAVLSEQGDADVAGKCHHRDRVHISGRNTCDQVCSPGAGCGKHYAGLTGCPGIAVSRVGRALLMGRQDVTDFVLMMVKRIIDIEDRTPGITENRIHSLFLQAFYEDFRTI